MEALRSVLDMAKDDPLGAALLFVFVGLWWVHRQAKDGRRRIYGRIDKVINGEGGVTEQIGAAADKLEGKIDGSVTKLEGEIEEVATGLREHEKGCSERAEDDARWKGRIEGELRHLTGNRSED